MYDLFISHAWKYGDDYDRLINLLDNAPYFSYRNYSAPKDKPLKTTLGNPVRGASGIASAIENKIRPVNCVIVLAGMYANNREWMEEEIRVALKYNKPIIAIKPWGNTRMPEYIQANCTAVVGWNTSSIVEAIRKHSL